MKTLIRACDENSIGQKLPAVPGVSFLSAVVYILTKRIISIGTGKNYLALCVL